MCAISDRVKSPEGNGGLKGDGFKEFGATLALACVCYSLVL